MGLNTFSFCHSHTVQIGTASETLSEWADDEAGLEAVQKIVDSLDDVYALQDPLVEPDVLRDILRDDRLHMLLQVRAVLRTEVSVDVIVFFSCSSTTELVALLCRRHDCRLETRCPGAGMRLSRSEIPRATSFSERRRTFCSCFRCRTCR